MIWLPWYGSENVITLCQGRKYFRVNVMYYYDNWKNYISKKISLNYDRNFLS